MTKDGKRTYVVECPVCQQASDLYDETGSDYEVMVGHPACQKCGVLIGDAHATRGGPICNSCVGMPGPASTVAESLRMAEKARLSLASYARSHPYGRRR